MALINNSVPPLGALRARTQAPANLSSLFRTPQYTVTTLLLWGCWIGLHLASTGIHTWLPTFFRSKGILSEDVPRVVLFTAFGEIPGLILVAGLVDRIGRRWVRGVCVVENFLSFQPIIPIFTALALFVFVFSPQSLALMMTLAGTFTGLFALTMNLDFSFIHAFFLNMAIRGAHSLIFVYTSEVCDSKLKNCYYYYYFRF